MKKHVLWAALLLLQNGAFADNVADSTTDNGDGTATVTYVVTVGAGKKVKDMHWEVENPKKKNLKQNYTSSSVPNGWSKTSTSNGDQQVFTTQADANAITSATSEAGGTFSFTFNTGSGSDAFTKFQKSLERVRVTATSNGSGVIDSGNVVFVGGTDEGGPNVDWPVAYVGFQPPGGTTVASIGSTLAFRIETSFYGGQAFKVYTSTALSQTENGPDNRLGIDIDTTHPIPAEWNIDITPMPLRPALFTESEDDLDTAVLTVSLPDDPGLVGQTFYLVAASDSDGDGMPDLATSPLRIVIQNEGSPVTGVDLLDYAF